MFAGQHLYKLGRFLIHTQAQQPTHGSASGVRRRETVRLETLCGNVSGRLGAMAAVRRANLDRRIRLIAEAEGGEHAVFAFR